ncbi:hypothetical protein ACRAWF_13855 [Streptomyces sp. L7]
MWTMGQQMYVIRNNLTPVPSAQGRLLRAPDSARATHHEKTRSRGEKAIVKAIVSKGQLSATSSSASSSTASPRWASCGPGRRDRAVKGEAAVESEDGTPTTAAPKRQQPKRQTKSQRQSTAAKAADDNAEDAVPKTSLSKSDEPEDAKPATAAKKAAPKPAGGTRSKARSGQRKGPQRPKSPSKK